MNVAKSPKLCCAYHLAAWQSNESLNSTIFDFSASASGFGFASCWEMWFSCHIVRNARTRASVSDSLLYFGYAYDMLSCSPSGVESRCGVGSDSSSIGGNFFVSSDSVFFTSSGRVSFYSFNGVFTSSSSSIGSIWTSIIVSSKSSSDSFGVVWLER